MTTYYSYQLSFKDSNSKAIQPASLTVYGAGTTVAATIYRDPAMNIAENNPMVEKRDIYRFYGSATSYDVLVTLDNQTTQTVSGVTPATRASTLSSLTTLIDSTEVAAGYQPLDADLTAVSNCIYHTDGIVMSECAIVTNV